MSRRKTARFFCDNKLDLISTKQLVVYMILEGKHMLTVAEIKMKLTPILDAYGVKSAILFGSIAKESVGMGRSYEQYP